LRKIKLVILFIGLFLLPITVVAQNISDYLILNDIGTYRISKPESVFKNRPPIGGPRVNQNDSGVLSGTDHFQDHSDTTYKVMHIDNNGVKPSPEVQVTQHTGGDSDRWLLHELDAEFRDYYGIPDLTYTIRTIDGNTIFVDAPGGRDYRWLSGNKVITLEYNTKTVSSTPEPLEIVQAYLAKHPSTLPSMTLLELRGNTNVTKWIKDEIDRRLWLCDKWNAQSQAGSVTQADLIYNLVRSMGVFLNYRQKYYGVSAKDDLEALFNYQQNKDIASIQKKLTEYKTWWAKHKDKSIKI